MLAVLLALVVLNTSAFGQQWGGTQNTTGNIFRTGNVGIGTNSPAYPLDIAGTLNLNKGKNGIALRVNDSEALWYDGTRFSWGYGGQHNYFADSVGIGVPIPMGKLHVDGGTTDLGNGKNIILKAQDTKEVNKDGGNVILRPGKCSEHFDNEGRPGKVEVHGELYVYGSSGFDATGKRATVYLGDQNHYICSVWGYGVRIGTYGVGDAITLSQGSGDVGIGMNPDRKLSVNGAIGLKRVDVWDGTDDNDLTWDGYTITREGSSRRYKQNIRPFQEDFRDILKLEAKQYQMKEGYGNPENDLFGYIAEDVEEVGLAKLVTHDAEGRPDGIKYKKIAIYLNEIVKEHEQDIAKLKSEFSKLEALKKENADLHDRIKTLESLVGQLEREKSVVHDELER